MKNLIFLIMILSYSQSHAQSGSKITTITGYIPDLIDTVLNVQYSIDHPEDFEIPEHRYFLPLVNGRFTISLNISSPTKISILVKDKVLGRFPVINFLMEPGDSVYVKVPEFAKTEFLNLAFSGPGSEKFNFLKKVFEPVMKYSKSNQVIFVTELAAYLNRQRVMFNKVDSAMQANKLMVNQRIFKILRAQTLSEWIIPVMDVVASRTGIDSVGKLYQEYFSENFLKSIFTSDSIYLNLEASHKELNYIPLLKYGIKQKISVDKISIVSKYNIVSDYYQDHPKIRNYLLAEFLVGTLKRYELSPDIENLVQRFLKEVPYGPLHNQVLNRYELKEKNSSRGVPFYNFELEDNQGNMVKLSDFKGKIVILDFYFTYCGPCRLLVPTIQSLEEKYKTKNVTFISINIDREKKEWQKGIGIFSSPTSTQLYTNGLGSRHPLIAHAGIMGYPTLFLLDKEGKILVSNMSYEKDIIDDHIEKALQNN